MKVNPEHTVVVSGGTAYRNPTFLDSYLDLLVPLDTVDLAGMEWTTRFHARGTSGLEPERLVFAELSYRSRWLRRLSASLDLFYRYHTNLYYVRLDTVADAARRQLEARMGTFNDRNAHAYGGEVSLDATLTGWLSVMGGYSYQQTYANLMHDSDPEVEDSEFVEIRTAPRHKINTALNLRPGGFRASVMLNWVDRTQWFIDDDALATREVWLDPYLLVNATLGYEFARAGVWVHGFNLFDSGHREYPAGFSAQGANAHTLHRRFLGKLTVKF